MVIERDKVKRWWQFSLKDLLLLVIIVALAAKWWSDHRRLAGDLRGAIEVIRDLQRRNAQNAADADYYHWKYSSLKKRLEGGDSLDSE
jgi:hypothetical protein